MSGEGLPAPMRRALELAPRALPDCRPNPAVGAVVVRGHRIVGEGWTSPIGGPHAEAVALRRAGRRAEGATLYVTLEPCGHHGRTPPCTDAILRAGIARVVASCLDPNPRVRGRGVALLREGRVRVQLGPGEAESRVLNQPFFKWVRTGKPYVVLKVAATLDGRIATASGETRWITGAEARAEVHRMRAESDAVLVGLGTVRADDPRLTARDGRGRPLPRQPIRIVLDSAGRTPKGAKVLDRSAPTVMAVNRSAAAARLREWTRKGIAIHVGKGRRLVDLDELLRHLGRIGVSRVLVEGGAETHAAFLRAGEADALRWFVAPRVLGGHRAVPAVGGPDPKHLADATHVRLESLRRFGEDWLFSGVLRQY